MEIKAGYEQVVIESKAQRIGEEVKSESGIVLGKRETGEIPRYGVVVSVGKDVNTDIIDTGFMVAMPNGRITNVPDPRLVEGQDIPKEKERVLVATHWKNVQVIYA